MNETIREPVISISGLEKKFGDFTAVNGISFDIYRKEIFGLLGPNGAGKTTTINMVCGLLPSTGGAIHFNLNISGRHPKTLIGYCPQENIYYPKLTCLEQLIFTGQIYNLPLKLLKANAMELLERLGLKEKAHERAGKLSGGMKRRLNICLALIHNPEILVLDEPEAGLDPQSRLLVREFIKTFGQEKTILLTTHNMDEADRLADRIAIMDYGKILLLDTPDHLKKNIGEGDILELILDHADEIAINLFTEKIHSLTDNIKRNNNSLILKLKNSTGYLSEIKKMAVSSGLKISEFKLRENTLEDVFIHLTGRSLRQ